MPFYALTVAVWTFGEVIGASIAPTIVSEISPPTLRGLYQGIWGSSWGLAFFIGPIFGGFVFDHFGSDALWAATFVIGLFVALGFLACPCRRAAVRSSPIGGERLGQPTTRLAQPGSQRSGDNARILAAVETPLPVESDLRPLFRPRASLHSPTQAWPLAFIGVGSLLAAFAYLFNLSGQRLRQHVLLDGCAGRRRRMVGVVLGLAQFVELHHASTSRRWRRMAMGLSVRIFGLNSWSILLPEAMCGVATIAVLFAVVRRTPDRRRRRSPRSSRRSRRPRC